MKSKLFDYIERDNFIFNLSGVTKLLCFLILTFTVMFSYDARVIFLVLIFSFAILRVSEIRFSQIRIMLYYVLVFIAINFILTFVFSPKYGVEIYGTEHDLFRITERYTVTAEQLLYQGTKVLKYLSVIPLGMLFLLTTNPSEFAASLSSIGVSYKASFALALTLRYFPDMIRDYNDIALAQQARGLDLSKKEKLGKRLKNMMNIFVPLIFSSLERVDVVSNAMDLRGFGKHKKRTWYAYKPLVKNDYLALAISIAILAGSLAMTFFVNHGRFWNPFI
ncbi:MAG: energy-coupling factor transporter transmembrane protein EcfT [Lachnospiraceae bacterium]|nr:energy-coupling factor transporter transmembrane protein EcfT [Lachnospiraceae bacterium]